METGQEVHHPGKHDMCYPVRAAAGWVTQKSHHASSLVHARLGDSADWGVGVLLDSSRLP